MRNTFKFVYKAVVLTIENGDIVIWTLQRTTYNTAFTSFPDHKRVHRFSIRSHKMSPSMVLPWPYNLFIVNQHFLATDLDRLYFSKNLYILNPFCHLWSMKNNSKTLFSTQSDQSTTIVVPEDNLKLIMIDLFNKFELLIIVLMSYFACCHVYIFVKTVYYHLFFKSLTVVNVQLTSLDPLTRVLQNINPWFYCHCSYLAWQSL